MRASCPSCGESYPIDAGFADNGGKRLATLFAGMEAVLDRAVIGYLLLFRPAKTGLRATRAIRLVEELLETDAGRHGVPRRTQRWRPMLCLRRSHFGGRMVYLPRGERLRVALCDTEISRRFNGRNSADLAKAYGVRDPLLRYPQEAARVAPEKAPRAAIR